MRMISIRPRFVEQILAGRKTVELRRRVPNGLQGQRLLIYSTAPVKAIVGSALVRKVMKTSPVLLWQRAKDVSCVTAEEFDQYFSGTSFAVGIELSGVQMFQTPINLDTLRQFQPDFHPPQCICQLKPEVVEKMFGQGASDLPPDFLVIKDKVA